MPERYLRSLPTVLAHPRVTRRIALQAGAVGLLGLGLDALGALREAKGAGTQKQSVIFIFLSGGLAQHDSFDLKPDAPESIRGEFKPIATRTPGVSICEHLPLLAERSHMWSLVRSLTHSSNDHSVGHHIMLTGRSDLPPGFNPNEPRPSDWPSIAVGGRERSPAAEQPAAGRGPARKARPQHRPGAPRPVRRA